jgi:hypothetical protein
MYKACNSASGAQTLSAALGQRKAKDEAANERRVDSAQVESPPPNTTLVATRGGALRDRLTFLVSSAVPDPVTPGAVTFAKALEAAAVPVELKVYPGRAHGFVNFTHVSPVAVEARHDAWRAAGEGATRRRMTVLYIDADACPVKDEVYKVAARYGLKTFVVSNSWIRVPRRPLSSRSWSTLVPTSPMTGSPSGPALATW